MAGGKGVGARPPPRTCAKRAPPRGGAPSGWLFVRHQLPDVAADLAEPVGQILPARLALVLDVGETGLEAGVGGIYPLLPPLDTASDRNGHIVAVFVDDALDELHVLLL